MMTDDNIPYWKHKIIMIGYDVAIHTAAEFEPHGEKEDKLRVIRLLEAVERYKKYVMEL